MLKRSPASAVTTRGLDTSHYDGRIDFKMVKLSGREFVIQKCTEYNVDNSYAKNKADAKAAGLLFGSYHFFHPSRDPALQAHTFLNYAQPKARELIPCLDWETTDNVPSHSDMMRAKIWLDVVEKATGRKPLIYLAPYFGQTLNLSSDFADYPLYIAHYGTSVPLVPTPWQKWAFHQYTEKGDVPGIPAPDEDLDVFNGSLTELEQKFVL